MQMARTPVARPGRLALLAAAALAIVLAGDCAAEPTFSFDSTPGKLPKTVVPIHYAIELTPDLENLTLAGTVAVDIEVREPAARLLLNAKSLTLTTATIGDEPQRAAIALDEAAQTATLTFPRPLAVGPHTLRIAFTAKISKSAAGLFVVDYETGEGHRRMLSSHFAPTAARLLFPSWDEPAFKATFALTVTVPHTFTAISNMPVAHEEAVTPTLKRVAFQPTPKMSSYLLTLTAGELEQLTGEADGIAVSVITTRGKRAQARFALESAMRLLGYFNRLLRRRLSVAQARLDRGARGPCHRHGALGRYHLPRKPALARSRIERSNRAAQRFHPDRPRDRAPMVRQSCHHGLVGQSLAQRRLCHLDGGQGD